MSGIRTLGFIIPTLSLGGAERVVARLASGLAADFRCLIFVRKGSPLHYEVPGVEIVELDYTAQGFIDAAQQYGIDVFLDHYHWDVEHVRIMAGLASAGLRVVLTEHNAYHYPLFQAAQDRRAGYDAHFTERYPLYAKFAAVTLLNDDAFTGFAQHLDNLRTIPNPVSYEPDGIANHHSRTVLNVSHFRKPAKRLDLLYMAYARMLQRDPAARLCIVGEYDYLNDRAYRRMSGLGEAPIRIAGRSQRVSWHYNESALFALTSSIEGQPMVLLEAALHAMPAVSFDLPGLQAQIVHGETGLLVPFGDTDAFADASCSLLADPARLRAMGYAARDKVQRDFALPLVLDTWKQLLADIERDGRVHSGQVEPSPAQSAAIGEWTRYWTQGLHEEPSRTPRISFLVPVHGTEDVLPRCLRSIQEQTLRDFECLIVDDESPGDIAAITRATVGNDPRFRVIRHARNRGLYQARSTAASAARGLYFANIDSDDYIHPRFAEILFREALATGSDIVECRAIELTEEGRPIPFNNALRAGPADGRDAAAAYFNGSLRNVVWNKIYARELWWKSAGHNAIDEGITISEDTLRNSFLFPDCTRYSAVADCLYYYCRRGVSVVKGGDIRRLSAKLGDLERSYDHSRRHVREALDNPHALRRLEHRRCEDTAWYIAEFLARHDTEATIADLLAEGESNNTLLLDIHLVSELASARRELKRLYRAAAEAAAKN